MNLKLIFFAFLFPITLFAKNELKVFTYGSFNSDWGPGPNIEKSFEAVCECDLIWSTSDSSGALLSKVKLTNNKEGYDLILGLDDSLMTEAIDSQLFQKHNIDTSGLTINWNNEYFTPFDYGFFSFIYNSSKISNPPRSLTDLANQDDLSIIIMDPRYSTPGLGLAKWIYQVFGDQSTDYWKSINDQIVITSKSWSDGYGLFLEGESDLVLSYSTSPAYHSLIENDNNYRSLDLSDGHASQIEVLGILNNASNLELAKQFVAFSLTESFQQHIPQGNWMYPVIDLESSQSDFYSAAPLPKSLQQIYPTQNEKQNWIDSWKKSIDQ
ncbi:MAG: thiamine ABC transporter substrate-binding protein [Pelagibacteraceae bacterium]|jgi:thiamine transport system substrate-binding protein